MIIDEVLSILKHERCSDVSAIMMAGGFSEADTLQHAIKNQFQSLEVFIPTDGSLSVLKGAVLYGHNPSIVSSRVCYYTYGIAVEKLFDSSIHDPKKQIKSDGKMWCTDIFEVLFEIDEEVHIGQTRKKDLRQTYFSEDRQKLRYDPIIYPFVISTSKYPFYITDEGCMEHGSLTVSPPNGMWPKIVNSKILLKIGGTELVGTCIDKETMEETSVRFEFLPSIHKNPERKRLFDPFYLDI